MFLDYARIRITSGDGGNGHISFRREKYVPNGGPDGGDGGKGGDIIFEVDKGMNTLFMYKHRYAFKAEHGQEGGKKRQHGKNGNDLILKVPDGTILKEEESGKVIADMSGDNTRQIILKGGRGGKGNMNYATPTMQAPQYAQPGKEGITLNVVLELKLVADVGLIGFPNAGKSTFLKAVTNANPKVANYPFTTIDPNLGVVDFGDGRGFVMADMPGLIEGASEGVGLGHRFLRHIERTRVLVHLVDCASFDGRDPVEDVYAIHKELEKYNASIMNKPIVIAANKIDAVYAEDDDPVKRVKETFEAEGYQVFPISAATGQGLKELLYAVQHLLETTASEAIHFEQEFFPEEMEEGDLPYEIQILEADDGTKTYSVEGPRIEKMLGYTNLDSEKGFVFFQRFFKTSGIEDDLKKMGIKDRDTVKMYGHQFDYYSEDMDLDEMNEMSEEDYDDDFDDMDGEYFEEIDLSAEE
ncbi:MAG: GTPase ObgE [Lachnospiraceae bacterium]|nr:GTPase ObgE [Candidatus Equihabitans merdae]